jgi:hypothetical protein
VNVTVEEAENLLNAEYHVYTHSSGAEQFGQFGLPVHAISFLTSLLPRMPQLFRSSACSGAHRPYQTHCPI